MTSRAIIRQRIDRWNVSLGFIDHPLPCEAHAHTHTGVENGTDCYAGNDINLATSQVYSILYTLYTRSMMTWENGCVIMIMLPNSILNTISNICNARVLHQTAQLFAPMVVDFVVSELRGCDA